MKILKTVGTLMLGAGILLAGQNLLNINENSSKVDSVNIFTTSNKGYYERVSENDDNTDKEKAYFEEMYRLCHGNNGENQDYRNNGMMRNRILDNTPSSDL